MTRIFTVAALSVLLVQAPAAAEPRDAVVTISNADLALSDSQFHRKISTAIEEVCRSYATVEPYQWPEVSECRKAAWAGVREQQASLKMHQQVRLSER